MVLWRTGATVASRACAACGFSPRSRRPSSCQLPNRSVGNRARKRVSEGIKSLCKALKPGDNTLLSAVHFIVGLVMGFGLTFACLVYWSHEEADTPRYTPSLVLVPQGSVYKGDALRRMPYVPSWVPVPAYKNPLSPGYNGGCDDRKTICQIANEGRGKTSPGPGPGATGNIQGQMTVGSSPLQLSP